MAVFRIEKTRDYTVMSNYHLRDRSLSLKAKGLLSLMLSLREDWDYTNGTFRNVPLLLSHACPCAGWFDAYASLRGEAEKVIEFSHGQSWWLTFANY